MGAYRDARNRRRAMRLLGLIRSAVLTAAGAAGALSILVFAGSFALGVRPLVVVSGSMEPTIPVGSVVFSQTVDAEEIAVGDVVTVERPRELGLITHRVVSLEPDGDGAVTMVLRGDANSGDDPQPYTVGSAGAYRWHVPGLGYVSAWLRSTSGMLLAGAAAVGLVALYLLDPHRLPRRDDRHAEARTPGRRRAPTRGG